MNKVKLRSNTLKQRKLLDQKSKLQKEKEIHLKLLELIGKHENCTIFSYVDYNDEVATKALIQIFLDRGYKVAVPKVISKNGEMQAITIQSLDDLKPGCRGILEPLDGKIILPEKIDYILVPGSVFDISRNRIGYGGGYYDRFLEKAKQSIKIGLAFDLQIVKELMVEEHDQPLDKIVTETRII